MKKLLYIAGPFSQGDPIENTHLVARIATDILEHTDYVPYVPHLSLLWHVIVPRDYEFWTEYDLDVLLHCDCIVRLPGFSPGACNEMKFAELNDIEIVDYDSLPETAKKIWEERKFYE